MEDPADEVQPDGPEASDDAPAEEVPAKDKGILDRLRDTEVGTQDPNIVGDAGPTDVAPGADPD